MAIVVTSFNFYFLLCWRAHLQVFGLTLGSVRIAAGGALESMCGVRDRVWVAACKASALSAIPYSISNFDYLSPF